MKQYVIPVYFSALIMDLSDICDKSYDSEEENKTRLE